MNARQFHYDLPEDAIATHPVAPRRMARLLIRERDGGLTHTTFERLPDALASHGVDGLWANDTRVLHARLLTQKSTGGHVEVFLLAPASGPTDQALMHTDGSVWKAMVRNAKRWTSGPLTAEGRCAVVTVERHADAADGTAQVRLSWKALQGDGTPITLGDVLEDLGRTPLPPYMKRADVPADRADYQTVFAVAPGSVAAPTAGLHYDDVLLADLATAGCPLHHLTLHVGAGTFKPLTEGEVMAHEMHAERAVLSRDALLAMRAQTRRVATGTTTLRAMESLFWLALHHAETGEWLPCLPQRAPYGVLQEAAQRRGWTGQDALDEVVNFGPWTASGAWEFETQLMIVPGYTFRMVVGLVTNFHQPGSTLLCLVAALVGEGGWRSMYETALHANYRFLSYGDGCLLWGT